MRLIVEITVKSIDHAKEVLAEIKKQFDLWDWQIRGS